MPWLLRVARRAASSMPRDLGRLGALAALASGVVQTLCGDFGTGARAGRSCARIDARARQSAVDQEAANVATPHARLGKDRANRGIVSQEAMGTAANACPQAAGQTALDGATIRQHDAVLNLALVDQGLANTPSGQSGRPAFLDEVRPGG